jgi:Flp pilus assembly pilin Flp
MQRNSVLALFAFVTAALRERAGELRRNPDRGSHAVEYAIGIGLGAAVIILLYGAYKSGVDGIIKNWVFK